MHKNLFCIFLLIIILSINVHAQVHSCGDPLADIRDDRIYKTVLIGNQCWMAENLNAGVMVNNFGQAQNGIIEKTCYNNDADLCEVYGGLYTWHEAMEDICPVGWHLPSNEEWSELNDFLGIKETGTHMKSAPDDRPAWDGDNSSGFSAIPSGVGQSNYFGRLGHWAVYWSSTGEDTEYAWFAQLDNHWYLDKYTILYQGNHFLKTNGFSVRCIKD